MNGWIWKNVLACMHGHNQDDEVDFGDPVVKVTVADSARHLTMMQAGGVDLVTKLYWYQSPDQNESRYLEYRQAGAAPLEVAWHLQLDAARQAQNGNTRSALSIEIASGGTRKCRNALMRNGQSIGR